MVRVDIDPGAGFCFGVEEVIRTAETGLRNGEELYALGDLVHNNREMERLGSLGLKIIGHAQLSRIKTGKVIFRAHGEPPSSYATAEKEHIRIIDGTCPIVYKLQRKIREAYRQMDPLKEQLVIFGKKEHPETIGLLGQVGGDATVISSPDEVHKVDPGRRVHLFSQTTMDPDLFAEVEAKLKALTTMGTHSEFRSDCTICGQMKRRKPGLKNFAAAHDVIIFVSGKHSSNGKMLFEFCRAVNPNTHWISEPDELETKWFEGADSVGISGATSTASEQLESVYNQVKKFTSI